MVLQRRRLGTNTCLIITPFLFCMLLWGFQKIINHQLDSDSFKCGCKCTSCCDWIATPGSNLPPPQDWQEMCVVNIYIYNNHPNYQLGFLLVIMRAAICRYYCSMFTTRRSKLSAGMIWQTACIDGSVCFLPQIESQLLHGRCCDTYASHIQFHIRLLAGTTPVEYSYQCFNSTDANVCSPYSDCKVCKAC